MKVLFFVFATLSMLPAQSTFTVEGEVFDYEAREPVAGARVTLSPAAPGVLGVLTDAAGHFRLSNLPAGSYQIAASRFGYSRGLQQVSISKGESATKVRVYLYRDMVVSGKVLDQDGWPVLGAVLQLGFFSKPDGEHLEFHATGSVSTDDLGEYRFYNLQLRQYYMRALPGPLTNWDDHYVPTYYPGVANPADAVVVGGTGSHIADIRLARVDGVHVRGRALFPKATVPRAWSVSSVVTLAPVPQSGATFSGRLLVYGPNGSFDFYPVPAGQYIVTVMHRYGESLAFRGQDSVAVGK